MCGIAGFAGPDRSVIEKMTDALVHRGPDGNAIWTNDRASLGHCRLAILDPRPEGDQPMWNAEKTIAIVYNGEIYNYRELRDEERLQCQTTTDTEVILHLYEKYGMDFVHRLRGMFAFGIYDTRDDSWHLARDSKGIKPLFIAYPHGRLAFASEMRSLMRALPQKPALNMTALSQYLRLQYVPGPHTLCEGIEQLPPGTILSWKNTEEKRRIFTPVEHASYASKADFTGRFPALMDDIVRQHLVSDKPVGIFLSGGMDSSVILHHMSHHASKPIKTFTVRFEATAEEDARRFNTDAELAKKTAEHYGTDHQEIFLTAELFRDLYADTARSLDQPNADHVSVAQYLLSREAKKHVDVVLTGAGGDELFGGYPRYRVAHILHLLRAIPPSLRSAAGSAFGYPSDVLGMDAGPMLAERLLARPVAEGRAIIKGEWFDPLATTALFTQRFAELAARSSQLAAVRQFMEFDRHLWLIDESLRLADATTMGSGLEARVPFVDERIIAASHATPASWHVTTRNTKVLLKDTYRGILPDHLYTLKKASFYPPLAKWLRREVAPLSDAMVEHKRIGELFDAHKLRTIAEEHRTKQHYHLHTLSTLIQLQNWFDTVYDAA
jgi:asparagine synthase (glutamine-hydrolysing)